MVPQPQHPHFDPQPWSADDTTLPGGLEPYFLRNGTGPKYLIGGTVCTPFATTKESAGRFCIGSVEGSSQHSSNASIFAGPAHLKFHTTHHCVQIADGTVHFTVDGAEGTLSVGETLFIPAGTAFRFDFASALAKMYVFANGAGLVELLCALGTGYIAPVIPEQAREWDPEGLVRLGKDFGYAVV